MIKSIFGLASSFHVAQGRRFLERNPLKGAGFLALLVGLLALPFPAHAHHAVPCPGTVSGTYELSHDLDLNLGGPSIGCVLVFADDVIIRLNGHSIHGIGGNIDGPGPRPGGILLIGANNVIVEGPGTITNFVWGVAVLGSKNVGIDGLEVNDNSRGIYITLSSGAGTISQDVTVTNTKVDNSQNRDGSFKGGQGILVAGFSNESPEVLHNIHLDNVEVENSEEIGIEFMSFDNSAPSAARFLVERCKVKNNDRGIGLRRGSDITIRLCEVTDNDKEGIIVGGETFNGGGPLGTVEDVKIRDSVITNNRYGLRIKGDNVLNDVKLRGSCFKGNSVADIRNNEDIFPVEIIQLDNQFDPPGGC